MAKTTKVNDEKKETTPVTNVEGPAQLPYRGRIWDKQSDGSYKLQVNSVKTEEITQEETGKIDLHLQGPEDLKVTISKEVAKLNEGFTVAVLDPEKNKLGPVEKIAVLKEMFLGVLIDPKRPEKGYRGGLKIRDVLDKDGYKKADETRKMLVKLRTGTVKRHGELKQNYLSIGRALDGAKNTIVSGLEEIEDQLAKRLKVIDDKLDEIEREAEAAKERLKDARVAELKANGLKFDGSLYSIGDQISIDVVTIATLKEDDYKKLLERVKSENERLTFLEYKRQQRDKVERYLLFRAQRKQRDDQQKLNDEKKKQKDSRLKMRLTVLKMLGFVANSNETIYQFKKDAGVVSVTTSDITENEAEAWDQRFADLTKEIEDLNVAQKEWENKEIVRKRNLERYNRMVGLGYIYDPNSKHFLIKTPELGETNFFSEGRVYEDQPDFETWFNNIARVDAEETKKAVENKRKEAKELQDRTNNRIAELINSFGLKNSGVDYYKPSQNWHEPELLQFKDTFLIKGETITNLTEDEWADKINSLTGDLSKFQQAEQAIKTRKEKEAEDARTALLTEKGRFTEWLDKLEALNVPQNLTDELLILLVKNIRGDFTIARERLKVLDNKINK